LAELGAYRAVAITDIIADPIAVEAHDSETVEVATKATNAGTSHGAALFLIRPFVLSAILARCHFSFPPLFCLHLRWAVILFVAISVVRAALAFHSHSLLFPICHTSYHKRGHLSSGISGTNQIQKSQ